MPRTVRTEPTLLTKAALHFATAMATTLLTTRRAMQALCGARTTAQPPLTTPRTATRRGAMMRTDGLSR